MGTKRSNTASDTVYIIVEGGGYHTMYVAHHYPHGLYSFRGSRVEVARNMRLGQLYSILRKKGYTNIIERIKRL